MPRDQAVTAASAKEISDKVAETQQLIQLSRQGPATVEQTQLPDGRLSDSPYFDPAATSYSK